MAWEFAQNMYGAPALVHERLQIGETCYVGQIMCADYALGGIVEPGELAGAGPDATTALVGICSAVRTSPTYTAAYQGDGGTYDTTQAAQVANDPPGPTLIDMTVIRPGDIFKAPLKNVVIATAPTVVTATATATAGLTVTHTGTAVTAPTSNFSTIYCRTGANRGQYRVITTGGTKTQTLLNAFTYDPAIGDTFVCANIKVGYCNIDFTTDFLGIDINTSVSNHYEAYCWQLNLEEAGKEFALVSFSPQHIWAPHD
uniref:Uncharacterized protein n=1 Tax=viral metagenome TaxID=1070528 RepID=A0A6M3LPS3_9ZZZZ